MKSLEEIKNMLCDELDEFARKGDLSAGSLETIHKLTDTIKNIEKIKMLEDVDAGEYDDWKGSRRSERSYNRGYSNRHYVRGHYSNADDDMSMARGRYSRGKDAIMDKMEEALGEATGKEREAIERCMRQLENA